MPTMSLVPATAADYRTIAERKLPRFLFDFADGGAYEERTLRANVEGFQSILMRQKVMVDVSNVDPAAEMAGGSYSMPLGLAPVGMAGMFARRGEVQAKRAADRANIPFTLSTVSICSMEEIAAVSDKPFWLQLYMLKDRGIIAEVLERAWALGVENLVFTVDLAVLGARYRDVRNGIAGGASAYGTLRAGLLSYLSHPKWLMDVGIKGKPHTFGNLAEYVPSATSPAEFRSWLTGQADATVSWKDIEWLRKVWKGRLILKGILCPEDARLAVQAGADGMLVSNHGGRQLDGVSSSIAMLPKIVDVVGDDAEVMMDGGVRSGLDVVRARALGASGVLMGRPWVYALAARGEQGISDLLTSMNSEMCVAMGLGGVNRNEEITREILLSE